MRRDTESYTVRKMGWVEAATAHSAPPEPTPTVIAIYHAALPHAEAARLADLLKRHGFPGEVVIALVEA